MRNTTEIKISVTFIRHGKTQGNTEGRYIGKTDEPLCSEGIEEIKMLKEKGFYNLKAQQIFCSPMERCVQTAEIIFPDQKINVIEEFREIDFGDFEGKNHSELNRNPDYQKWIFSNGTLPFPKGESQEDFIERSKKGFEKLLENAESENITAIVHGGTIMSLISAYYGGAYFDYLTKNGQGYECTVKKSGSAIKITEIRSLN